MTRLYLLKWFYQYQPQATPPLFKDIIIQERLRNSQLEYYAVSKEAVQKAHYIFDHLLFYYTVNTLKYFCDIHLIDENEKTIIQEELFSILNDMEQITLNGRDPVTGNEILLYVSLLNLDTNYLYVKTEDWQLTGIKLFQLSCAGTLDKGTFDVINPWIESLKKHSMMISNCNEVQCRCFLERQRRFVERLSL